MAGAVERAHMQHPDFRAGNGKIFASLTEDEKRGMATLTPDQQAEFVRRAPSVFVPAAGAWGRSGCTMVVLANADAEVVGEAVTLAWQFACAKSPARQAAAGRPAVKRRLSSARITGRRATSSR